MNLAKRPPKDPPGDPSKHPPKDPADLLPIDDLDQAIVDLAGRLNARTYELLVLLRQFDERVGWLRWGFSSCAEWLHWRCDLSLGTAREKVRVAHALKTLPVMSAAFRSGRLSYSKVRALTRVAAAHNEQALVAFALTTTAARVEARVRELRCGTVASLEEARRVHARRSLAMFRNTERGTMTVSIEIPLETGELLDKALDKARAALPGGIEFAEEGFAAQQADALIEMAKAYLSGASAESKGTPDHYQVMIHVDQKALTEGQGRSGLPLETVKRLSCDGQAVPLVEDDSGEPLSIGRKSRIIPASIQRALWARDQGCRFPGCNHTRFVDGHHVEHWANGGETSLSNLVLLCDRHHRLVHEGGYRIEKDYLDRWSFVRPDGIAVPEHGYRLIDMLDETVHRIANENDSANVPAGVLLDASGNPDRPAVPGLRAGSARRRPWHHDGSRRRSIEDGPH